MLIPIRRHILSLQCVVVLRLDFGFSWRGPRQWGSGPRACPWRGPRPMTLHNLGVDLVVDSVDLVVDLDVDLGVDFGVDIGLASLIMESSDTS